MIKTHTWDGPGTSQYSRYPALMDRTSSQVITVVRSYGNNANREAIFLFCWAKVLGLTIFGSDNIKLLVLELLLALLSEQLLAHLLGLHFWAPKTVGVTFGPFVVTRLLGPIMALSLGGPLAHLLGPTFFGSQKCWAD